MTRKTILFLLLLAACKQPQKVQETDTNHFPAEREKANWTPKEGEKFYIYLLAGQSNMAGRAFVEPADTVSSLRIFTLNKNNEWEYAKEPLHFYEPGRTGLDCGLAFARKLSSLYGKKVIIGLVPCAIGGSSIEQWLGDSTYRGVTLYTNFITRARAAAQFGEIKGLLWHQGETNANTKNYKDYKQKLQTFFSRVRADLGVPKLNIYAGLLGSYLSRTTNPQADNVNKDLESMVGHYPNFYVINTLDFTPLKDSIHFDTRSQRLMGERFAKKVKQMSP
jgi:hypothetical protein